MTFQVGKNGTDYKRLFGVFSATLTIFGTVSFTALIIEGFYGKITSEYYNLVWLAVSCMLGGVAMLRIYSWSKK